MNLIIHIGTGSALRFLDDLWTLRYCIRGVLKQLNGLFSRLYLSIILSGTRSAAYLNGHISDVSSARCQIGHRQSVAEGNL